MTTAIYGLVSTRDNEIRYIGETLAIPRRFAQHYWVPEKKSLPVHDWIRLERWCGYDIHVVELVGCDPHERLHLQMHWTNALPDLVNVELRSQISYGIVSIGTATRG